LTIHNLSPHFRERLTPRTEVSGTRFFPPLYPRSRLITNVRIQTLAEILTRATKLGTSPLDVVERVYDGKIPDVKPPVRKKLKAFVEPVRLLRKLAEEVSNSAPLFAC
jgi:hypothetical protein